MFMIPTCNTAAAAHRWWAHKKAPKVVIKKKSVEVVVGHIDFSYDDRGLFNALKVWPLNLVTSRLLLISGPLGKCPHARLLSKIRAHLADEERSPKGAACHYHKSSQVWSRKWEMTDERGEVIFFMFGQSTFELRLVLPPGQVFSWHCLEASYVSAVPFWPFGMQMCVG